MRSKARTVAEYLKELPVDRRAAIEAVRKVVRANVDGEIEEGMQYGAIGYYVPFRVFPQGYHCDPNEPLPYLGIASQKNFIAVYLFCSYMSGAGEEEWIRDAYAKAGRKLDMGKSCLRFKSLADLDLGILAEAIRRVPMRTFIARYVEMVGPGGWKKRPAAKKAAAKKAVSKKTVAKKTVAKKAAKKK